MLEHGSRQAKLPKAQLTTRGSGGGRGGGERRGNGLLTLALPAWLVKSNRQAATMPALPTPPLYFTTTGVAGAPRDSFAVVESCVGARIAAHHEQHQFVQSPQVL